LLENVYHKENIYYFFFMLHSKQKAFTLVELIVVVTILAILATIWFVSYSSYLTWVRDTNRIAQMTSLSDGLNLYSTTNDLPIPEDNVEISAGTDLIAYQGYAGANILETINFEKGWVDPKDNTYFSYYLTKDRKYFQLMWFLEESTSSTTQNSKNLILWTYAVSYENRIPTVYGRKLWILTNTQNTPIQDLEANLDLLTSWVEEFNIHISDDEVYLMTWPWILSTYSLRDESLLSLDTTLVWHYNFDNCNADDSSILWNDGILNQSPNCVSAKKWKWYEFNGLNQYVIIPRIAELEYTGGGFSLGFWINASSDDTDWWYIFSKPWNGSGHYNYSFLHNATGWVSWSSAVNITYGWDAKKDDWQHVFLTLDWRSYEMKVYLNGKNVNTDSFQSITSWVPSLGNNNVNLALMTLYPYWSATENPTHAVKGMLDEVYIFNRALTEYEIWVIYRK
jgi:prepilin-type N-terminal cleavage/methylation domain-containing protein